MIKSLFLKKAVFAAAAFTILLQIVFLFETGNNSLAQTGTIPNAPSSLRVEGTQTSSSIPLRWNDNSINEDKFNIERKSNTDSVFMFLAQVGTDITSYADTSVATGLVYNYRVQACLSGSGCSGYTELFGVSPIISNPNCLLTVSLSPNTPPAQNVSSGQTGVPLVKFNLLPNCAMTLNSLAVSLLPYPNGYSNIYSLRLYKDGTQMGSVSVTGANVNFTGLNIPIPASQAIVLEIKGDISTSATAGSTFYGVFGGYSQTGAPGPVEDNTSGNIFAGNIMTITGYTGDMILPTMPTGLIATKDDYNEVDLSWTASTDNVGVAGYKIWRSNGTWINLGSSSATTYIDATVASGTGYYYKITAYDAAGNESTPSTQLFLNTPATSSSPLPPPSVIASSSAGKIIVSWPMSTSAGTYSIHRKVNNGSYQPLYSNITSLYYHDFSVTSGDTYQYKVMGCDATICSTTGTESTSVIFSGSEASCTGLILTLNDGKTSYAAGDAINYTWTCYPGGSASNVSMRLYKPDSTSSLNDSGSGSTKTMILSTSSLVPGTYTLKSCFDTNCTTVNASKTFTIVSATTTPVFMLTPQALNITGYPLKKLMKVVATSNPAGYVPSSIAGKIKDSTGNVSATFDLAYQSGNYWTYEHDITGLNGNYTFCASGIYNSVSIPWICSSTSFSATSTTPSPAFTVTSELSGASTGSSISGVKTAYANAAPSISGYSLSDLRFKFKNTSTGIFSSFLPSTSSTNHWEASIDTSTLANGNYDLFAEGFYAGTSYKSTITNININNSPNPALNIYFINTPAQPFTGNVVISAQTNQTADSVNFKVTSSSGNYVSYTGTSASSNQYSFTWPTSNFSSGIYKIEASASRSGQAMAYAYLDNVSVGNAASTASLDASFVNVPPIPLKGDVKIFIRTNIEPELVNFKTQRDLGSSAFPTAVKIDATNYYFLWNTGQYYDGKYTIYATVKKGLYEKTVSLNSEVANYSASTTPAQTSDPFTLTFTENLQPPISGDRNISISSNLKMDICKFKVEGVRYAEFAGLNNGMQCSFLLHTFDFPDGKYLIRAIASSGTNVKEIILYTSFSNQPSTTQQTPLQPLDQNNVTFYLPQECKDKGYTSPEECQKYMEIPPECRSRNILDPEACKTFMYQYGMPPECVNQGVQTSEECQKIIFSNSMPPECKDAGATTREECDKIMSIQFMLTPECKNANITAPDACQKYMTEKFLPPECNNSASQEECNFVIRNSYATFNNLAPLEPNNLFKAPLPANDNFPPECKELSITSPDECKKHMMLLSMPPECQQANTKTGQECEKIMFKKYGPKECTDAGVFDPIECEKIMFKKFAPEDCKQAEIFNPEACKKFMYEKYDGKENIPKDKFPIECQKAKANTPKECEKVMKTAYMPEECKDKGITDQKECDSYFEKKYMPPACKEAGATTREECDKAMFKKYAPNECLKAGIEKDDECQKFMFNLYAPRVKCDNLEDWQCKKNLEEKHLGNIVAKQSQFSQIKENSGELIGRSMDVEALMGSKAFENNSMIPLVRKDTNLKMVSTMESMVLNDEDNLVQTGPIAFMIDSDGDELSDDMEKLLGTDPDKADTDDDGYSDGNEMKTGHDPLGPGLLTKILSPAEKAMIDNATLEHPKTSGEFSEALAVEKIENLSDISNREEDGYLLSGKSESGSIVTVYIYSDLPLVLTVKADETGNWQYELDRSLSDGEHEVYVVVNDETGKVVNKSKPSNLFVKSAKAVSASAYLNDPAASLAENVPEDITSNKYNYIVFFSITAALSVFGVMLILRKRKKQPTK